jgi:protein-tyrosine phosphatase
LPGIDDGSPSVEDSIYMLRMQAQQGIGHVVATPHFYARYDEPEAFLARRDAAEAALREEMEKHSDLPRLTVGAEVYFFRGMSESDLLPRLTIGDGRCILVEMPHGSWSEDVCREVSQIWEKRGIIPVIAHIDRYIRPWHSRALVEKLEKMPVFVQANAEFFLKSGTTRMALRLLHEDKIHLLGSDCHNLASRAPNLGAALTKIEKKLGKDILKRVHTHENQVFNTDSEM